MSFPGVKKVGNKYHVRVQAISKRTGKKVQRRATVNSLAEVAPKREELLAEIHYGRKQKSMTLGDFGPLWLERKLVAGRKPGTIKAYSDALEYHILPALGHLRLDAIMPRDVDAFVRKQRLEKRLAARTIRQHVNVLAMLAKAALRDEHTDRLFCFDVETPDPEDPEDKNVLTAAQLASFLSHLELHHPHWHAYAAVLAYTGMRQGELHALSWDDIDWDNSRIHVRKGNWRGLLQAPKTRGSKRVVPMGDELASILQRHRERLIRQQHRSLETGLVYASNRGAPYKSYPAAKLFRRLADQLGIPEVFSTHGFRHTFITLTDELVSSTIARKIAGHATQKQTDGYTHVSLGRMVEAQGRVIEFVQGSESPEEPDQTEGEG